MRIYNYMYIAEAPLRDPFPAPKREEEEGWKRRQQRGHPKPASERCPRAKRGHVTGHRGTGAPLVHENIIGCAVLHQQQAT